MGADRIAKLSPRQRECMRMVAQMETSDAIAFHLKISPKTVDSHIAGALKTLGVTSRRAGAKMFVEHDPYWGKSIREIPPVDLNPDFSADPNLWMAKEMRLRDVSAERSDAMPDYLIDTSPQKQGARSNDLTALQRLGLITIIALIMAAVVIAAKPMAESYQALANFVQPLR